MTTMIVELYEALRAAGAPEDKAQAAARADHERRLDHVGTELATLRGRDRSVGRPGRHRTWITGTTFAGILALILRTVVLA
jgi:hypothetical protein